MPLALPPARRSRATLVSDQQALQEPMFAYVFTFEVAEGCPVLVHVD